MFKNIVCSIVLMAVAINSNSQDTARIVAAAKVLSASANEIEKANEKIAALIKDPESGSKYFDQFVMIGAHLWNKMKDHPDFKNIDGANITFKVPKFESDGTWRETTPVIGKAFQSGDDFKNLLKFLKSNFDLHKATIVEKNLTDKFVVWQYFAKIQEPLIALKNDKMRLAIQCTEKAIIFMELTSE